MFSQIDEETMKEFCMCILCIVYMERLEIIKRAER